MLYAIKGNLLKKEHLKAIIDVGGIVFDVTVPLSTLEKLPKTGEVTLFVELVIGEKNVKLYGFYTEDEKKLFDQLRKISKIGAQTALSILSNVSVNDFFEAIKNQDSKLLMSIPGIGKKTALSIIVEMASKIPQDTKQQSKIVIDSIETLVNLGFSKKEASSVVNSVYDENNQITLEELIKESLKRLRKNAY